MCPDEPVTAWLDLQGIKKDKPRPSAPQRGRLAPTPAARNSFWKKVAPQPDGCWLWMGAVSDDGYGRITWSHRGKSRTVSAHRFALLLFLGSEFEGVAAHECDTPLCVRVGADHVHVSSQRDNMLHAIDARRHNGSARVVDSRRRRDRSLARRSGSDFIDDPDQLPLFDLPSSQQ